MPEIITLTKEILEKYIDVILNETTDFEFIIWNKDNYLTDLPDKWNLSLGLFNNGEILGFSVNSRKSDIFYIHFLYIFKKHRNAGAGKTILTQCAEKAREYKLNKIQLKCSKLNTDALKFYLEFGFTPPATNSSDERLFLFEKKLKN